ncbi:MAG: serine hydrolase [Planctomycetota bacterium]|nr:serine hydrolase [Planctomycetota bacterium]
MSLPKQSKLVSNSIKVLMALMPSLALLVSVSTAFASDVPGIRDRADLADFATRWEGAMESLGVPGFTVAIIKDGELYAIDQFGKRDLKGRPADADTMYYIASCTKTYNGLAIAKLAQEGKLDLDAPVRTYLPQFKLADEALASRVTVRDLLCHRYGINHDLIVFQDAYTGQITDEKYFAMLGEAESAGEIEYTNVHFTILGHVIKAVTGKHWRDYLHDEIFTPLGMSRTSGYASQMYGDENAAEPMIQLDGVWQRSSLIKSDRTMHAAGGLGTTARDAATWIRLHLNGGTVDGSRLVSEQTMDQILTMQAKHEKTRGRIRAMDGFAMAWFAGTWRSMTPYYQHGGGYLGAAAHLSFLPEKGIGVVVLANVAGSGHALCDIVSIDIYDRLLDVKDARDLLPSYEQRAQQMVERQKGFDKDAINPAHGDGLSLSTESYVGEYVLDTYGTLAFSIENGDLVARCGDLLLHLAQADEKDAFDGWIAPNMSVECSFKIDSKSGTVTGLTMIDEGEELYFTKK